jgi:signal transduction histidine kinase
MAAAQIIDSAHYLDMMVNELLDQAQIESRTMILHMARFSPTTLLQRIETNMSLLARNRGLAFSTSLEPGVPSDLYGDQRRLEQILINLIGNAIKFTKHGEVCVRLYQAGPQHWAMQVRDTGVGIPKDAQELIFEPFRQVNNAVTHENRGTGLGLSITRQLVELMEGRITLESEVGRGSSFTITLPILKVSGKN